MRQTGILLSVFSLCVIGPARADESLHPVLVQFASAPTPADIAQLEGRGARVTRVFGLVPGVCAQIPAGLDLTLLDDPRIVAVDADVPGTYLDEYTEAWSVGHIGSEPAHSGGARGEGVKLAILDSGIHAGHPDLADNFVFGYDFEGMSTSVRDSINHGTHVSGTAAAVGNGFGVIGVAPDAGIHMLKVGSFAPTSGAAIAALEWAVANGVQVTNSSFALQDTALLKMAYDAAWEAGIVNVAASGNSGVRGIGAPAKYDSVIAVGATDSADRIAGFSTYGPELELCAPGVRVYSTYGSTGYNDLDGTSMASPHVAGVAALIIDAGIADANGNGRINDEVRLQLRASAIDIGAAGFDERTGWGLVEADAAVDLCTVDLDGSGTLDVFDFLMFQNLFGAGDVRADFSGDGVLDLFDFLVFQNEFAVGCD